MATLTQALSHAVSLVKKSNLKLTKIKTILKSKYPEVDTIALITTALRVARGYKKSKSRNRTVLQSTTVQEQLEFLEIRLQIIKIREDKKKYFERHLKK